MNSQSFLLVEFMLHHEHSIPVSEAHRAWHLDELRRSRAARRRRTSSRWRTVTDRLGGWFAAREPGLPGAPSS